jgi:hypothetical protein
MKQFFLVANVALLFSLALVLFSSCQRPETAAARWYLTGADSIRVVQEVSAALDA